MNPWSRWRKTYAIFARSLSQRTGLAIDLNLVVSFTAQQFHPDCVKAVESGSHDAGPHPHARWCPARVMMPFTPHAWPPQA